jgi:colicin import membrane protein
MNSSGLFSEIKKHPWILALVVIVHLGLAILLGLNLSSDDAPPMPAAQKHKIINAVAVDAKLYDEKEKQKKLAAQKRVLDKKAAEKALIKKTAEKKRIKEKEKQKKLAITKKKEAEKKAAEKRAIEKKAVAKRLKEKRAAEKLAAEKRAKEIKERERKELERKKLETEIKRQAEEERQRRAEEKAELERALFEEERREEEARRQAEHAARLQTMRERYVMMITQKVENNWLRPVAGSEGQSCDVIVTQTMMGDVIDVRLQSCTSDNAFQRSVERAVRKASPLPVPPDPELFDREIYFTFKPR